MSNSPQTYTISDFIEWNNKKQLRLDPDFQRGSVWTSSAKVFLIDTILNDLPMPQVYFRTKLDTARQTSIREVVDGQQRLRSILEFASGRLKLTGKAGRFKGKTYADLDPSDQERFLAYKITAVQLINASDADVLEVFARLNSYSVKVTPAELRHAEYSEPVKWAIYHTSRDWRVLWDEYKVVSIRDAVRLKNTSVTAEFFMILDVGFGDGGEPSITKYYKERREKPEEFFTPLRTKVDEIIGEIIEELSDDFDDTTFFDSPNFLIVFAAVAYLKGYISNRNIPDDLDVAAGSGVDWENARENLAAIAQAFDDEDDDAPYASFVAATKSTTHRLSSRKQRFKAVVEAIS
ncbi:DUF262 domain-containing protein [Agrobacterium sp. a22-2]|uniref:GmrSD restriction endonuclease domain-containing protein n=1 Tax=Agrobacterium TaxID=357 RepID=UPI000D19E3B2|nr:MULTISPECIES: DUF262 domain-containing protein [Agrobacterium]NKN38652.1 DUF262 domain-containing protein [Agrobacterium sp. a22-2]